MDNVSIYTPVVTIVKTMWYLFWFHEKHNNIPVVFIYS